MNCKKNCSLLSERLGQTEEWQWYQTTVVDYFRNQLGLKHTPEQIHRAIGLLNVNAVKLQFPKTLQKPTANIQTGYVQADSSGLPEGKGLYPIFAIMSHYCVCNARYFRGNCV